MPYQPKISYQEVTLDTDVVSVLEKVRSPPPPVLFSVRSTDIIDNVELINWDSRGLPEVVIQ